MKSVERQKNALKTIFGRVGKYQNLPLMPCGWIIAIQMLD